MPLLGLKLGAFELSSFLAMSSRRKISESCTPSAKDQIFSRLASPPAGPRRTCHRIYEAKYVQIGQPVYRKCVDMRDESSQAKCALRGLQPGVHVLENIVEDIVVILFCQARNDGLRLLGLLRHETGQLCNLKRV